MNFEANDVIGVFIVGIFNKLLVSSGPQSFRWHICQLLPQSRSLEKVIEAIDTDPYGCFRG